MKKVLVVGATGQTGKHVVAQLLQKGHTVSTIARSKQRLFDSINEINSSSAVSDNALYYDAAKDEKLSVTEAAILDLTDEQIANHVRSVDAVVCCLGHNLTFKGIYGKPRRLVTDATERLCRAIQMPREQSSDDEETKKKVTKFILMGSDGVANPDGTDDIRSCSERALLCVIRALIPPHSDNEGAARYLSSLNERDDFDGALEWVVVRPTDLIDGVVTKYDLLPKPRGGLFGGSRATRSNVAKCMVDLILNDGVWEEYKFKMPVLHDAEAINGSKS